MQDDERQLEIEGVVQPVLRDHGLMLVDLEWRPRRPRGVLRLFVDKPGGVGIDDCQRLSREVGDVLDASALDRESTRLNSSHSQNSYAVFCLQKKKRTAGRAHLP